MKRIMDVVIVVGLIALAYGFYSCSCGDSVGVKVGARAAMVCGLVCLLVEIRNHFNGKQKRRIQGS